MSAAGRALHGVAEWWRKREAIPAGEAPWVARQVRDNIARLEELEARQAEHEAEVAARISDLFSVMDAVAQASDARHPDLEKTMPMLRLVQDEREAG